MEWRDESTLQPWTQKISGAQNDHLTHALASKNKFLEDMKSRFFGGMKMGDWRRLNWCFVCCLFQSMMFSYPLNCCTKTPYSCFFAHVSKAMNNRIYPPRNNPSQKKNLEKIRHFSLKFSLRILGGFPRSKGIFKRLDWICWRLAARDLRWLRGSWLLGGSFHLVSG